MAKTYLSGDDFIRAISLEPVDFDVPGLGLVQVRGLTTAEYFDVRENYTNSGEQMVRAVHFGLVNPKLNDEQLLVLGNASPTYISMIAARVLALSGRGDSAATEGEAGGGS